MDQAGKRTTLLQLFLIFLKIGAFTFGGGYAMIALLENEFVTRQHWISSDEFLDMTAIAESTPGPIAVNSATFLGYRLRGIPGSLTCTFAVCLPSFVIIYLISLVLDRFLALTYVSYAFHGIQVCVVYLICSAGFRMLKSLLKKSSGNKKQRIFQLVIITAVILLDVLLTLLTGHFSTIWCILACGVAGLCWWAITAKQQEGGKN